MRVDQIDKYRGEWCRVMYVSPDGEAVTSPIAMPRYPCGGNDPDNNGTYRFTTGGPTGGWELFVYPSDVINVTPIKEGT